MKFVANTIEGRRSVETLIARITRFGRDITIRHESNVSNGSAQARGALSSAQFRGGIKDATVNLSGSSFRWRNTIVQRCRWPEMRSKGHPRVRPFYCDTIYDCSNRLLWAFHILVESLKFTYVIFALKRRTRDPHSRELQNSLLFSLLLFIVKKIRILRKKLLKK